jgi:YesN/AraC family two-component response regulator
MDAGFFRGYGQVISFSDLLLPKEEDYAEIKDLHATIMHSIANKNHANLDREFRRLEKKFMLKDFSVDYFKKVYYPLIDLMALEMESNKGGAVPREGQTFKGVVSEIREFVSNACNNVDIQIDGAEHHVIRQCIDYICRNYSDEDLGLQKISDSIGYNGSYLSRVFKQKTGRNLMDYINEVRIENAKRLLREQKIKAYNAAESVGYSNYSYFCRVFKKFTGMSPSRYSWRKL